MVVTRVWVFPLVTLDVSLLFLDSYYPIYTLPSFEELGDILIGFWIFWGGRWKLG